MHRMAWIAVSLVVLVTGVAESVPISVGGGAESVPISGGGGAESVPISVGAARTNWGKFLLKLGGENNIRKVLI